MARKESAGGPTTPRAWRNLSLMLPFGQVNVGIGSLMQAKEGGHICCEQHSVRTQQRVYCPACDGKPEATVKGYEYEGNLVTLTDADIAPLEGQSDDCVTLTGFVEAGDIDPIYFDKSYTIWPQRNNSPAYALLVAALRDSDRALVGKTTLTKTTRLMVVRWSGATSTLVAHICHYGANVKARDIELVQAITEAEAAPAPEALSMVETILGALPSTFDPYAVEDEYTERLMAAIAAKASGVTPERESNVKADRPSDVDLMAALKAAAEQVKAEKVTA